MVDSINKINSTSQLNASSTQGSGIVDNTVKDIGKDAFLKLLVAQLKNQDPLDPQDQGEFAVDLAQFTQVEQLTEINKKLGGGDNSINGLASYLGHSVVLKDSTVEVDGGEAGSLQVELPVDAASVKVDLYDDKGSLADTLTFSDLPAGKQMIDLKDINASSGIYTFDVKATTASGNQFSVDSRVAGVVSGFIPGPQQTLLVGGREVSLDEIMEVTLAK